MRIPRNERVSSDIDGNAAERTCILSGGKAARDAFVRLAISPDGLVLPDVHARAPGRGAWIGVSRDALEIALSKGKLKGALARAYKGASLSIPEDLADRIENALTRSLTDRLGLELKSGRLLMGSDRIAQNAREGRVEWLAHAADASVDGSRKLDQAWRVGRDEEGSGLRGTRLPLDREALSVALGRDNVVHLALNDRGAATRVASQLQRLLHFQGKVSGEDIAMETGSRETPQGDLSATDMDDGSGAAPAASVTTN
ncbi:MULTISPECIES: DUF448 domain-containing protein [Novosphingobium]|uniref:Transcription terminating nucleic-acid-binding protein n=1 Tax=Novosphingobium barchaimii LL02 TaxID=1114963 RepID=A0A0J7XNL1_9SPHN|nr:MULTISPECIES: DUF448 domain-containing protein [Novosphingobium]AXB75837.1 DUF448 domain-containing protein [Novosphingobium sp. P6W]KIS32954.1 nucleic-acid-binding protein [Novosphingobium sp. P6W]KMS53511.1 transcription terminating nucleic-acid-binding protein [Novosphingobium barchaimii LL02]